MSARTRARVESLEQQMVITFKRALIRFANDHDAGDQQILARGFRQGTEALTPEEQERYATLWSEFLPLWKGTKR